MGCLITGGQWGTVAQDKCKTSPQCANVFVMKMLLSYNSEL